MLDPVLCFAFHIAPIVSDGDWRINSVEQRQRTFVLYMSIHPRALYLVDVSRLKPEKQNRSSFCRFTSLFWAVEMVVHPSSEIRRQPDIEDNFREGG